MNILIVDDDPNDRILLKRELEKNGHSISWAANARAAVDQMRIQSFDLVLLDINLREGVDGMELVRRKRTEPRIADIPVVMMTGYNYDEYSAPEGVIEILVKPVKVEELENIVRRHRLVNV